MQVHDVMSNRVICVAPDDNAIAAAKLMSQHNIGAVPVAEGNQIKGMLTDRDIVLRCVAIGKNPGKVKASDIMSTGAVTLAPAQPLKDAIDTMASEQIRRLPVVDGGKLTGIVSLCDIARANKTPEVAQALSEISLP